MALNKRFVIPFEDGRASFTVHVPHRFDPAAVAKTLGFYEPRPTIYLTGGAGGMSPEDIRATRVLVERGLARFAQERGVTILDGGTHAGIPVMIGDARRKHRYQFPLVGIAPLRLVTYPGFSNDHPDASPLNSSHSHFVLTAGDEFGDESEMITYLTDVMSGSGQMPALGILINGGQISREEVHARTTSDKLSFPLVVIEGSGRFADVLARAFYVGHTDDQQVEDIITKGNLTIVSISDGPNQLYGKLSSYFNSFKPTASTV